MAAKLLLTVLSGPIRGKVFEFNRHDTFLFGRGTGCHAELPNDPKVSRHHFLLEVNPPKATVRDLGSLNGTYVNGVQYGGRKPTDPCSPMSPSRPSQVRIENGDRITVGKTTILVQIETPESQWDPDYVMPLGCKLSDPNKPPPLPGGTASFLPQNPPKVAPEPPKVAQEVAESPAAGGAARVDGSPQMPESSEIGRSSDAANEADDSSRDNPPVEIDGYRLGKRLGEGGMGAVYAAVRVQDEFPVAIKVMVPKIAATERARLRFLREIDILRDLSHPNIVTLLESGVAGKAFYFVVEFCNGGSLADLADRCGGRVPVDVLKPIIMQTLAGLDHAHQRGLIHRDLKPHNILLHQHGAGWVAKLGDFGIAKQFEQAGFSGMTLTGTFGGTFDFMPREQVTNFKGSKPVSDVWSIAATFYRVITGASPRLCPKDRDPMEVVLCEPSVPIRHRDPGVPPVIAAILDKALAVEPRDRFQNAGEMLKALTDMGA
jgi:pSer/pThr/pTyr-binding forkhead associated (FHA) protein